MANYYVAKDGNDASAGTSWALAKLSIGGAVVAAATGDVIWIAGGEYGESVLTSAKALTFKGVGEVIVKGDGNMDYGFFPGANTSGLTLWNIIVDGFERYNVGIWWGGPLCLYGCTVRNGGRYGVAPGTFGGGANSLVRMHDCLIYNNKMHGVYADYVQMQNCVLHDNGSYGLYLMASSPGVAQMLNNCIFSKNVRGQVRYLNAAQPTQFCDNNLYALDGTTNIGTLAAVNYPTLAAFQAAITGGGEANSISAASPDFADAVHELFGGAPYTVQLAGAGLVYENIGLDLRYPISAAVNPAVLTEGVFSDVS